jgi:hypothetical protein
MPQTLGAAAFQVFGNKSNVDVAKQWVQNHIKLTKLTALCLRSLHFFQDFLNHR